MNFDTLAGYGKPLEDFSLSACPNPCTDRKPNKSHESAWLDNTGLEFLELKKSRVSV